MWKEGVEQCVNMLVMDPYPGFKGEFFENALPQRGAEAIAEAASAALGRLLQRETIKMAARCGIGALTFAFVDPREAKLWVDDYYRIFKEECVPIGYAVNPNVAMVTGFSLHPDEEESRRRGEDGLRFFRYGLAHHYIFVSTSRAAPTSGPISRRRATPLPPAGADHGIRHAGSVADAPAAFRGIRRRPDRVHSAGRPQQARAYLRRDATVRI